MNTYPIVVTTIQSPTDCLSLFSKKRNFKLFVSGDNKTPKDWSLKNSSFISISDQKKKYPKLDSLVAENHYARKNFAYLEAIKTNPEYLFETDDDNFPNSFFPNFIHDEVVLEEYGGNRFINIYSIFTKQHVWPRGLPLNYINQKNQNKKSRGVVPLIQQALADNDPDVDAIYRLAIGKIIKFKKRKMVCLSKGTYSPFNSQVTYWNKKVFPLLYLPSTVNGRITDVWRGYIAQRILWELGSRLIFISPCVFQKRNEHNLMKDFSDETNLYLKTESMVNVLNELKLSGTIPEMMTKIYTELIKKSFFKKEELKCLKEWNIQLKRNLEGKVI